MATRLELYNGALRECGERKLASLTENREPRRLLDGIWQAGEGVVKYVLQRKQWRFGRRSVELTYDEAIEPAFGYSYAFAMPDDAMRTCGVWSDERMNSPLLEYHIEGRYWYADVDPIYVTFVSSDTDYGGDLTIWPPNFVLYVETHMASLIAHRLTGSKSNRNDLLKLAQIRLKEAANSDAMESPTTFPPAGSWVRARAGGRRSFADRGSRSRLIG